MGMINLRRIRRECHKADGDCRICRYGYGKGMGSMLICGAWTELILGARSRKPKDWDIAKAERFIRMKDKEAENEGIY